MTEDDDLSEMWDDIRPPPPPEELEKRRLKVAAAPPNTEAPALRPGCQQCGGPGSEGHSCPYDDDIHGGSDGECNCCQDCTQECANDI